ncbi:MAG: hypothetical protein NVSMB64_31870 [Candidatus Velthaea sp.]
MVRRFIIAVAGIIAITVVPAGTRSAGLGLDVSPVKLDISTKAGATYNIPVTVTNSTADSIHVQASESDFDVTQSGDYEFMKPGARIYSLMKWATINPREFDLPAGTTQQVRVTLSMPNDPAMAGEYAGIVFFQTRPERKKGAVSFSARVATKIYDTMPGTTKLSGAIEKMSVASSGAGQLYRVLFKNVGNTHVYLNGHVEIRRDAKTVEKLAIPAQLLVERGGQRLIEVSGKKLDAGSYDVVAVVDYGGATLTGGQVKFEAH